MFQVRFPIQKLMIYDKLTAGVTFKKKDWRIGQQEKKNRNMILDHLSFFSPLCLYAR